MAGETEEKPSGWTVDTLRAELNGRFDALTALLQERYDTQETAMRAALAAAEKAVATALLSQEKAITAALLASDKAIAKAEVATEKRFESVNEFREQLSQIIAGTMPREVAEKEFTTVNRRLDTIEDLLATQAGARDARQEQRQSSQPWQLWVAGAVVSLIIALAIITIGAFT